MCNCTVDKDNRIHVVSYLKTLIKTDVVFTYVLNVLDDSYRAKHSCTLDFQEKKSEHFMHIPMSKNNDIIMVRGDDPSVYVCDSEL